MMMRGVTAVLFDADGVVQRPTSDWWSRLSSLVPADGEAFVADLMAAEKPSLVGKVDFRDALADVLRRWNSPASVDEALEPWSWFAAEPEVVSLIASLRAAGVGCHLATNQQAYRRAIMQDERGYGEWFDQTFYSCDLGLAKPDRRTSGPSSAPWTCRPPRCCSSTTTSPMWRLRLGSDCGRSCTTCRRACRRWRSCFAVTDCRFRPEVL